MKTEERDILINISGMGITFYAREILSKVKHTWKQNVAIFGCDCVFVAIAHLSSWTELSKLCFVAGATLLMPVLVPAVINGLDKSENKLTDTVEHNVGHIADKVDDIADAVIKNKK